MGSDEKQIEVISSSTSPIPSASWAPGCLFLSPPCISQPYRFVKMQNKLCISPLALPRLLLELNPLAETCRCHAHSILTLWLILQVAASLQPIRRAPSYLALHGILPGLHPSPASPLQSDLPKEDSDYECGLRSQTDPGSHPASSNELGKSVNLSEHHSP